MSGCRTSLERTIDHPTNTIALRPDINQVWYAKDMTFVPKMTGTDTGKGQVVAHCLANDPELIELCHNRPLRDQGVSRDFLLARFAWTLFPQAVHLFLAKPVARQLIVVGANGQPVEELCCKHECDALFSSPIPKSTSLKKRQKKQKKPVLGDDESSLGESSESTDDLDSEDDSD